MAFDGFVVDRADGGVGRAGLREIDGAGRKGGEGKPTRISR